MSAWCVEALDVEALDVSLESAQRATSALSVRECPQCPSAKSFLLSRPSGGVYTCARASASRAKTQYELVLWSFHLERLASGVRTIRDVDGGDGEWVKVMQHVTTSLSERVIGYDVERASNSLEDLMITVLWWRESNAASGYNISVHACAMPTPKSLVSSVLIHGKARANAICKHTKWIADRIPLEEYTSQVAASHGSIHETILGRYDAERDDTVLLEGLITNFFVVKNGTVYTAKDDVLLGSTRALVLKACKDLGIPVIFEAPRLSERDTWTAAFVTSAVRLAIRVTRVLWTNSGSDEIHEFLLGEGSGVVERIRQHILDQHYFLGEDICVSFDQSEPLSTFQDQHASIPENLLDRQMRSLTAKDLGDNQTEAQKSQQRAYGAKTQLPTDTSFMATFRVDPAILDDPTKSFEAFKAHYPKNDATRENKILLKQKYDAAKELANVVNDARNQIKNLTLQIEKLRKQQAITEEGLLDSSSSTGADPNNATSTSSSTGGDASAAESKLKDKIKQHKLTYKKGFHELSELKKEIQHIQKMLEMSRIKLQKDFDLCDTNSSSAPPAAPVKSVSPARPELQAKTSSSEKKSAWESTQSMTSSAEIKKLVSTPRSSSRSSSVVSSSTASFIPAVALDSCRAFLAVLQTGPSLQIQETKMIVHGVDISTREGWMVKINNNPSMFGKSMNRRWFRVAFVPAGHDQKLIISYAKTKTTKEPCGWLYLGDDMIEVVSPARTLRFKGETTAEHRLWSDSLHKLCNPPKPSLKLSIEQEEEKKCQAEVACTEEAKALARQREQDRERIADSKKSKDVSASPAATAERKDSERALSQQQQKPTREEEQPERNDRSNRHRAQEASSDRGRGDRSSQIDKRGSQSRGSARGDRHSRSRSRSQRRSQSDNGCRRRRGSSYDDGDSDEEPPRRASTHRQPSRNDRHAVSCRRDDERESARLDTRGRPRDSSDDDNDRGSEHDERANSSTSRRNEAADPRLQLSSREDDSDARRKHTPRRQEHDSDSNASDDSDDDDRRGQQRLIPAASTERRPSLLVSQIKSASPCVTSPVASSTNARAESREQAQRVASASKVPPGAVRVDKSKRDEDDDDDDDDDQSDEECDPEQITPREPSLRPTNGASALDQRNEHGDDEQRESKDAEEEKHTEQEISMPPASANKKKNADYFDSDDDEEKMNHSSKPSSSNNQPSAAFQEPKREERLKSGGNGTITRDNNFVEDDWDAEDNEPPTAASAHKNGTLESATKVSVGFGGVAADSNFASEDWDD
ncbi:Aminotransferase, class iv, partial [Globisporangium splendens]